MIEFVMPKLGLTMEEGTILQWLKSEGDLFEQGEPLVEIESDKAAVEVEAPSSGVLGKVLVDVSTVVSVGQVIAYLLEPGEECPNTWPILDESAEAEKTKPQKDANEFGAYVSQTKPRKTERVLASPIARRLAEEKGVNLSWVEGSGPNGRITEKDVVKFVEERDELSNTNLYPPNRLKRITGERLSASFSESPHFYLRREAVLSGLVKIREEYLPEVEALTNIRLTYTDLFLFILAKSISLYPYMNSQWENGKIRRNPYINIGLAVAVDDGLIVPVIKCTDQFKLEDLVIERDRLTKKAIAGKLSLEELQGGTFTLTNLGMLGVDEFCAILNPPQAAILAVGRIAERAVVTGKNVIACPTVHLTLTVDHRVVDGAEGARFLKDLVDRIESVKNSFQSE